MQKKILLIPLIIVSIVGCNKKNKDTNTSTLSNYSTYSETYSSSSIISSEISSVKEDTSSINYTRKVKVYINPSVQTNNLYNLNLGSEAKNMNEIALIMYDLLKDIPYLDVNINSKYLSLSESTKESNAFGSDIHLALHSNAGGGKGSEIYTIKSKEFSSFIYSNYRNINVFPDRGIKDGSKLYELKTVKAPYSSLIELSFHDNDNEAKWIVNNYYAIASNLANSIDTYAKEKILKII